MGQTRGLAFNRVNACGAQHTSYRRTSLRSPCDIAYSRSPAASRAGHPNPGFPERPGVSLVAARGRHPENLPRARPTPWAGLQSCPDPSDAFWAGFQTRTRVRVYSFLDPGGVKTSSAQQLPCSVAPLCAAQTNSEPGTAAKKSRRLLRQPGGFEGFIGIEEASNPNHLAVFEIDQEGERRLGLGSACLATSTEAAFGDEALSQVADLKDIKVKLNESLVQVSGHLADALVSPVHRRIPPE